MDQPRQAAGTGNQARFVITEHHRGRNHGPITSKPLSDQYVSKYTLSY
jgi:hypothetical protein